ncbi:MAG: hypothetical protein ACK4K3_07470 [Aquabacterium sp.]
MAKNQAAPEVAPETQEAQAAPVVEQKAPFAEELALAQKEGAKEAFVVQPATVGASPILRVDH